MRGREDSIEGRNQGRRVDNVVMNGERTSRRAVAKLLRDSRADKPEHRPDGYSGDRVAVASIASYLTCIFKSMRPSL